MRGNKNIFIIVIILLIGVGSFSFGYYLGASDSNLVASTQGNVNSDEQEDSFDAGWEAAKDKIEEAGLVRTVTVPISSLNGTVLERTQNTIRIVSPFRVRNPLAEQPSEERTIEINEGTEIIKRTEKSREELIADRERYREERTAYRNQILNGERVSPPVQPPRYVEAAANIDDITNESNLIIKGTDGEDLTYMTTINATKIYIMQNTNNEE